MSAPAITRADLERLILECAHGDKQEWLDERSIEGAAILMMVEYFVEVTARVIADGEDVFQAIGGSVGFAFQIGFEVAEQFRSGRQLGRAA